MKQPTRAPQIRTLWGLYLALGALGCSLGAFAIRKSGLGMYETGPMSCPAYLPDVNAAMRGLALAAFALGGAAILIHVLRGRDPSGWRDRKTAVLDLAVFGLAFAAVLPALIAFAPQACA